MRMMPSVDYDPDDSQRTKPHIEDDRAMSEQTTKQRLERAADKGYDPYSNQGQIESIAEQVNDSESRLISLLALLVDERTITEDQAKDILRGW